MPMGLLQDRYWFVKNLKRHQERLGSIKAETDSSAPKLAVDPRNDKRKVGAALQRVQRINNDNSRLLVRLSKVFAHGGNLKPSDLGKDPKLEHQRKALRNNASKVIKKRAELNRITYDNKLLLNRILDVPSVINFKDEHFVNSNRRHKQMREETTYYRQKHSPFPISAIKGARSRAGSVCSTPRVAEFSNSRPGSAPPGCFHRPLGEPATYLAKLQPEHLNTVLNMVRPPELVKRVFSALMILVSPFEPSHFDVSWFAVQQWIQELGSVETFLENLRVFDHSMVPPANVQRTVAFMRQSGLRRERLEPLSESLAELSDWIWATCEPSLDTASPAETDTASPTPTVELHSQTATSTPIQPTPEASP
eukprot:TRINITY_DN14318_c0_g1_i1.p1 TRINITY_DN14318_c0_g1~~TRINITY_DN14318_c0_g1_i1.p1  ORF type:complete len:365 (-),score=63.89 TRINITY_DN14318_c0_g1_i1:284-1378(-)